MRDIIVFWLSVLFVAMSIMMTGCASKIEYVDRVVKVNIPVRCIAPDVTKSEHGKNDAESLLGIIRERDELREVIKSCR